MGPSAIRYAELNAHLRGLGLEVDDWGDVGSPVPETTDEGAADARYVASIMRVCEQIAVKVSDAVDAQSRPARARRRPLDRDGDARRHGHGARPRSRALDRRARRSEPPRDLAVAETCTACRSPRRSAQAGVSFESEVFPVPSVTRVALVGVRSLDQGERDLIRELDVRVFTMSEIDKLGVERVLREALAYLAGESFLHVSLDLDAVDPMFAPGVGHACARRALLPRGASGARARRRVGPARLARRRRGEPDPRP